MHFETSPNFKKIIKPHTVNEHDVYVALDLREYKSTGR